MNTGRVKMAAKFGLEQCRNEEVVLSTVTGKLYTKIKVLNIFFLKMGDFTPVTYTILFY